MTIVALLKESGLSRREFAALVGVQVKTTYWIKPPLYAFVVLKQAIELLEYQRLRVALRRATDYSSIT